MLVSWISVKLCHIHNSTLSPLSTKDIALSLHVCFCWLTFSPGDGSYFLWFILWFIFSSDFHSFLLVAVHCVVVGSWVLLPSYKLWPFFWQIDRISFSLSLSLSFSSLSVASHFWQLKISKLQPFLILTCSVLAPYKYSTSEALPNFKCHPSSPLGDKI